MTKQISYELTMQLITKWQRILNLRHWEFTVSKYPPSSKSYDMEIIMVLRRQHASIRIQPKCYGYELSKFEHLLIHEMLHPLFQPIRDRHEKIVKSVANIIDPPLRSGVMEFYTTDLDDELEKTLDHIAKVLYSQYR